MASFRSSVLPPYRVPFTSALTLSPLSLPSFPVFRRPACPSLPSAIFLPSTPAFFRPYFLPFWMPPYHPSLFPCLLPSFYPSLIPFLTPQPRPGTYSRR
jgi:hypothetical protein